MKQCGRCGTQNLDIQSACSACGSALPEARAGLGGTLVMTPEQTARYVEITSPEFMEKAFSGAFDAHVASQQRNENLNLIG